MDNLLKDHSQPTGLEPTPLSNRPSLYLISRTLTDVRLRYIKTRYELGMSAV
jgi:hypothetical protein